MRYLVLQMVLMVVWLSTWWRRPRALVFEPHVVTEVLGTVLTFLGVAVGLWGVRSLGAAFQVRPEPHADAPLVTRGAYRVLRHPMYTAWVGIVVGVFLLQPSWELAGVSIAIVVFLVKKAAYEEQLLRQRHPDYASYARRTFGVVPWRRG